jgi:hypothetical protein
VGSRAFQGFRLHTTCMYIYLVIVKRTNRQPNKTNHTSKTGTLTAEDVAVP